MHLTNTGKTLTFLFFSCVFALLLLASACGGKDGSVQALDGSPDKMRSGVAKEVYHFRSLPELVCTSYSVIIGTTKSTSDGRWVGTDSARPFRLLQIDVTVEETLKGSVADSNVILELTPPLDSVYDKYAWTQPGQRAVLFIDLKRDSPPGETRYLPISSQGAYHVIEGDRLESSRRNDENELSGMVASWSLDELRAQVAQVKDQCPSSS